MTNEERAASLHENYKTLYRMRLASSISVEDFYRSLICIAHGWVELGDREEAKTLLSDLTPVYVDKVLPLHMRDDPTFHKVAFEVAKATAPGDVDETETEVEILLMQVAKAKA